MATESIGSLSCLNVAGGDVKISFDKASVADRIRAKRIIKDMLSRGYALIVEVEGAYQRVEAFDEEHNEYIIADLDSTSSSEPETAHAKVQTSQETPPPQARRGRKRRLPVEGSNAVGVARSAGG